MFGKVEEISEVEIAGEQEYEELVGEVFKTRGLLVGELVAFTLGVILESFPSLEYILGHKMSLLLSELASGLKARSFCSRSLILDSDFSCFSWVFF